MAHAATAPDRHRLADARHAGREPATVQHPPVTPGKVAMWLFLATEVMFFTGLIGSYIVLRAGSPPTAYSNLYPAGDRPRRLVETRRACCSTPAVEPRGGRRGPRSGRPG